VRTRDPILAGGDARSTAYFLHCTKILHAAPSLCSMALASRFPMIMAISLIALE
jgi:hypothetical protein